MVVVPRARETRRGPSHSLQNSKKYPATSLHLFARHSFGVLTTNLVMLQELARFVSKDTQRSDPPTFADVDRNLLASPLDPVEPDGIYAG